MKATIKLVDSTVDRHCVIVWRNIVSVEYASGSNKSIDRALLTLIGGRTVHVKESVMDVAILIEQAVSQSCISFLPFSTPGGI